MWRNDSRNDCLNYKALETIEPLPRSGLFTLTSMGMQTATDDAFVAEKLQIFSRSLQNGPDQLLKTLLLL